MDEKKTVLLTGLTGFIGRNTARKIIGKYDITALVRPNTNIKRYKEFVEHIKIVHINLSDKMMLASFLEKHKYDFILHIGALRGGRKFSKAEYLKTNINATEVLMNNAIQNDAKFIFCSSVGVYGAIPIELPANLRTPFQTDNLYHTTKIQCEKMIHKAILDRGLNACIVRPAITYGVGDYGFPYTLIKLVDKKLLFIPKKRIYIHLTNVEALTEVFSQLLENHSHTAKVWNVADSEKVEFSELVNFIYKRLQEKKLLKQKKEFDHCSIKPYPANRFIKKKYFDTFTKIAKMLKNELWISRFELISNSWFYDMSETYQDFKLKNYKTIPDIKTVIDWYCGN